MPDWKRFYRTTQPPSAPTPSESGHLSRKLQAQNQQLTEHLLKALETSQALAQKQADTLDRIVQSKFDLPLVAPNREIAPNVPMFPPSALTGLLDIEDDREFLNTVASLTEH
jgi:hypothetical protein